MTHLTRHQNGKSSPLLTKIIGSASSKLTLKRLFCLVSIEQSEKKFSQSAGLHSFMLLKVSKNQSSLSAWKQKKYQILWSLTIWCLVKMTSFRFALTKTKYFCFRIPPSSTLSTEQGLNSSSMKVLWQTWAMFSKSNKSQWEWNSLSASAAIATLTKKQFLFQTRKSML